MSFIQGADFVTPEKILIHNEQFRDLSEVAKEIIFLALNAPSSLSKEHNDEPSLVKIDYFLRMKMKRKWKELWTAKKEIRQLLRNLN